jgi:hypothetical protein
LEDKLWQRVKGSEQFFVETEVLALGVELTVHSGYRDLGSCRLQPVRGDVDS